MTRITALSLSSRIAAAVAQFGCTALVVWQFSQMLQAQYFVLLSLSALTIIFEQGLSQLVTVLVARRRSADSHGAFHLNIEIANLVSYCSAMFLKQTIYFLVLSLLVLLIWTYLTNGFDYNLFITGICIIFLSAIKIMLLLVESIVEGLGNLEAVYFTRISSNALFLAAFAYGSISGFGLWALVFALLALVFSSLAAYLLLFRKLVDDYRCYARTSPLTVDYQTSSEIKKFRSQISLNWIASYGISNLPAPLAYVFGSPALAALVGVSTQFAAIIGVLCAGITAPRVSIASALAANGEWEGFRALFKSTLILTMACAFATTVAGASSLIALSHINISYYSGKLPTAVDVFPFALTASVYVYVFCIALFYRALQIEPFAKQVFRSALLTAALIVATAPFESTGLIGLSQLVAVLTLVLPVAIQHHTTLTKKSGQFSGLHK